MEYNAITPNTKQRYLHYLVIDTFYSRELLVSSTIDLCRCVRAVPQYFTMRPIGPHLTRHARDHRVGLGHHIANINSIMSP